MSLVRSTGTIARLTVLALLTVLVTIIGCGDKPDSSGYSADGKATTPSTTQVAEPAEGNGNSGTRASSGITEVSYIPPNCLAGALVRFNHLLALETMKWMPIEVAEAFSTHKLGIDIHDIGDVVALVNSPSFESRQPPEFGGIVRFSKAYDLDNLFQGLPPLFERVTLPNGKPALAISEGGMSVLVTMPDDKTLLVGTPVMINQMLANKDADTSSAFVSQFQGLDSSFQVAALVNVQQIPGEAMQELHDMVGGLGLPDWATGLVQQATQLRTIDLGLDLSSGMAGQLTLGTKSKAAAEDLERSFVGALTFARQLAIAQTKSFSMGDPIIDEAFGRYVERVTSELIETVKPTVNDDVLVFNTEAAVGFAGVGTLTALLLPAVGSAREAARRMASANNLKQIGLALRNYHNTYGEFPVGESERIKYKDGKPLLSWRVHILPFMEQGPLYEKFHLDEPWDSPHNIQLADSVVPSYMDPRANLRPGYTTYVAPQGPNTVLGSNRTIKFRDIPDGESQVIAVLEVGSLEAVHWSQPDTLEIDPEEAFQSVNPDGDDFQVLLMDGSVHNFSIEVLFSDVIIRLIQRNDGEPIPDWVFYGDRGVEAFTIPEGELSPDLPEFDEEE